MERTATEEISMDTVIELKVSKIITEILNRAFMTVALEYNLTKENAPRHPAFLDPKAIEAQLHKGLKMYGYVVNDKTVGCVGYWCDNDKNYYIERLATLPEYRHLGIGKKLMEFVENKMAVNGGKTIEIHVLDKNILLIEWYKKLGYAEIRIDELKHLPFNSYVMGKTLVWD
jgi:ribosomal protein S18 acetylase RimI-like enzyme